MKKIFLLIIYLCYTYNVNAQTMIRDTVGDTVNFVYNRVYKNIAAFNIKYASMTVNRAIDDSPFYSTENFFYEDFLPDYSSKMVFEICKLNVKYPIKGYELYKITLNGMRFQSEKYVSAHSGPEVGKYFLVAVDKKFENIKFISGQFFINAIRSDFALNLKDPASLTKYLELKTYNQQVHSIKYIKSRHHKFYYSAFSETAQKPIEIILDTNKIEYPKMIVIK